MMRRFSIALVIAVAIAMSGCFENDLLQPLVNERKWDLTSEPGRALGPQKQCQYDSDRTAAAQLDRWAWFEDGTTFIELYERVDASGRPCDSWIWNVANAARDTNVSQVPLLAEILNPDAIEECDLPDIDAILHVARAGVGEIRVIRSFIGKPAFEQPIWKDSPVAVDYPKPNEPYTITNPIMEMLRWEGDEVNTRLRRISQYDNFGFYSGFQVNIVGKWEWIDDSVDLTFGIELDWVTEDANAPFGGFPKSIELYDCTLRYEDCLWWHTDWIRIRSYYHDIKPYIKLWRGQPQKYKCE